MNDYRRVGQASPASAGPPRTDIGGPAAVARSCPTLRILLVGDASRPEFRAACAVLDEVAQVTLAAVMWKLRWQE